MLLEMQKAGCPHCPMLYAHAVAESLRAMASMHIHKHQEHAQAGAACEDQHTLALIGVIKQPQA